MIIKLVLDINGMSGATDWIEKIEDKIAETLAEMGYSGDLYSEKTGNSVAIGKGGE